MGTSGSSGAGGGGRPRPGREGGSREADEAAGLTTAEPPGNGCAAGLGRLAVDWRTSDVNKILPGYSTTDLGWTTFLESFPLSNRADDASFPFGRWPGPAVWGFARGDMHCVALVLVTLLSCFVFHKLDVSSLLFLLGIIDAVARSRRELEDK